MKISQKSKLLLEFLLIFVVSPISFTFSYPIFLKLAVGILGFLYIIRVLWQNKYSFFKKCFTHYTNRVGLQFLFNFIVLGIVSLLYLYSTDPDSLFNVVRKKPKMWITFIGVYTFLSVIPQELIYRSFYFNRYQKLINNKHLLLFMNAIVFSLGHIFFMSPLVLGITFVGGWVFAYTYTNTKSLLLVSIEHAIYGCWLYTVGFGELLGFPVP